MNRSTLSEMSVSGYFSYFAECLAGGWWFIPTLIPCLVAAPFISKGIEHLSDKGVLWLGGVIMALSAWGLVMGFLGWMGAQFGMGILSSFSSMCLNLVPPGFLVGSMKYFQFFIMGGVFRRLAPHFRGKAGTVSIIVGLLFLVQDVLFTVFDIPQADPSYSWMFAAFGIMVLFDRVQIKAKVAERIINWTAKRSYSIYLIQYGTITLTVRIFSALSIYAAVSEIGVMAAMAVWVLLVVVAYFLALGIASICDTLLLANLQKLFNRLVGGKQLG